MLLDACVPERFARFIPGHDVTTVRAFFGTTDVDDGALLDGLTATFEAFITADKHLRFQQNLRGRPFADCAVARALECDRKSRAARIAAP